MNNNSGNTFEEVTVPGFEVPTSPVSSYNNLYEVDSREPPLVPPQLQHTSLGYPASSSSFPTPQYVTLNHLYIENQSGPRSVVALGLTHRFRARYVNVVLYKPVQRRGNNTPN